MYLFILAGAPFRFRSLHTSLVWRPGSFVFFYQACACTRLHCTYFLINTIWVRMDQIAASHDMGYPYFPRSFHWTELLATVRIVREQVALTYVWLNQII